MTQQMDLLTVVEQPTWKELLIDLVASQKINPWDVDLIKVADGYLQTVRKMQALDLRIPANVILACALLLKFKAESLKFEQEEPEEYYEETQLIQEQIPELVYKTSQARSRKVTLNELLEAVEEVMREGPHEPLKISVPKILELELPKIDMSELMQKVYSLARQLRDQQQLVLFSSLVSELKKLHENGNGHSNNATEGLEAHNLRDSDSTALRLKKIVFNSKGEALAFYLVPVLHLVQENKLLAWQEEHFSEIFLKILETEQAQPKQN